MEGADSIKKRVTAYVQGKHGLIGLIPPEKPMTPEEWKDFHKRMVDIVVESMREEAQEANQ